MKWTFAILLIGVVLLLLASFRVSTELVSFALLGATFCVASLLLEWWRKP